MSILRTEPLGSSQPHEPVEVNVWIEEHEDTTRKSRLAPASEVAVAQSTPANIYIDEAESLARPRGTAEHQESDGSQLSANDLAGTNVWLEEEERVKEPGSPTPADSGPTSAEQDTKG